MWLPENTEDKRTQPLSDGDLIVSLYPGPQGQVKACGISSQGSLTMEQRYSLLELSTVLLSWYRYWQAMSDLKNTSQSPEIFSLVFPGSLKLTVEAYLTD